MTASRGAATRDKPTTDRVTLTERMTLSLLCTTSPPLRRCRVPQTSSMHAGCHSRRMSGCSDTMPFPIFALNCHHRHLLHAFPGPAGAPNAPRFTHKHTRTHKHIEEEGIGIFIHSHSLRNTHPSLCLCVIYTQQGRVQPTNTGRLVFRQT